MSLVLLESSDERYSVTTKPAAEKEGPNTADVTGIEKRQRASNGKQGTFSSL